MKKVLIIQTAFIGDVILATALIEKIAAKHPQWKISFLLRKGNESLLTNNPHLEEVLIWDKKAKIRNLFNLINKVRKRRYDYIVNIQRFFSTGLLTALSGANEKIGFHNNPLSFTFNKKIKHVFGDGTHEVDRNIALITHFTNFGPSYPKLYPAESDYEKVPKNEKYITVSPASVWFTKQFPKDKWMEFINNVESDVKVYLLGGGSDEKLCLEIQHNSTHKNIQIMAGKLSFLESAALMQNAVMNYVNDSAPLHLCSAMNAPVTAIFCSTVPEFGFTPLSAKSHIVEASEIPECRPCGIHGKKECPEGHFKCSNVNIQLLIEKISK